MTGLALLELKLDDHRMHVQHDGETSALLRWWGDHGRDAYFYMQVIDIASFQDCPVVYPASRLLDDGRNFRLNCWELPGVAANELLDKMCSHRDTMKTARAVVRYWVESHPHALADGGLATVLSFPQPGMATMVSKGVWRNFAFPLRARVAANSSLAVCKAHVRVQRAAERAAAAGAAAAAAPPAPADLPPLPDIISRLMLQLRQWSPFINVDQEGENLAELEATLHLLDTLKGLLSYNPESQMKALRAGGARLLRRFDDNRGFQYMGSHLLNCLLLSQFLQSQNALKAAVRHSLQILLPADVGAAVFEHLMSTPQPSSGTISKSKLRIDAAFMLDRRRQVDALVQAGKRPAVYLKTDSSPQAGEDWLLTQYMWIDAAKLMEALQAADHLYFAFYEGAHASLADSKAALQLLWSELKWHSLPPVGIGSGRSGLAHKFRAFLHSLFLECGGGGAMRNLCEFTNSWAIAIVSDRGVESNFLRTRPVRPSDLLAWHGCLWPDGRDARIDAECFGEEEVEIGSQPMIDMRKVLDIPGFAHGLHNISARMLPYLSHFESLKPKINAIAKLLHNRWTRKRFFASCLVGDYEIWRQHFESFPAHLITWRWLSLVTLCKGLAKVEVYVRGAWDRAKYQAHCREAQPMGRRGRWQFDRCLRSGHQGQFSVDLCENDSGSRRHDAPNACVGRGVLMPSNERSRFSIKACSPCNILEFHRHGRRRRCPEAVPHEYSQSFRDARGRAVRFLVGVAPGEVCRHLDGRSSGMHCRAEVSAYPGLRCLQDLHRKQLAHHLGPMEDYSTSSLRRCSPMCGRGETSHALGIATAQQRGPPEKSTCPFMSVLGSAWRVVQPKHSIRCR